MKEKLEKVGSLESIVHILFVVAMPIIEPLLEMKEKGIAYTLNEIKENYKALYQGLVQYL